MTPEERAQQVIEAIVRFMKPDITSAIRQAKAEGYAECKKEVWEKVNALGGTNPGQTEYGDGYCNAIGHALIEIEALTPNEAG